MGFEFGEADDDQVSVYFHFPFAIAVALWMIVLAG